jgi:hypothetical protein
MQDDDERAYHSSNAYVYTDELALELDAIWRGIDRLEQHGVSLNKISRALREDWETSVISLAQLGRRP